MTSRANVRGVNRDLSQCAGSLARVKVSQRQRDGALMFTITCRQCRVVSGTMPWSTRYGVPGGTGYEYDTVVDMWVDHLLRRHPTVALPEITNVEHFSPANVKLRRQIIRDHQAAFEEDFDRIMARTR